MINELDEFIEIKINTFSWGEDLTYRLDLYNITTTIKNYIVKTIKEEWGNEKEYYKKYNGLIKSKIYKGQSFTITEEYFNTILNALMSINFETLYNENYSGDDGWEMIIEITKNKEFTKYTKRIELFSPGEFEDTPEIKKLLNLIEDIEKILTIKIIIVN